MNSARQLRRNYHFATRIPALPGDTDTTTNSFWVCGDRISVIGADGLYTTQHNADASKVLEYAKKLEQQEKADIVQQEQQASLSIVPKTGFKKRWSSSADDLLDQLLELDMDLVRSFASEAQEAAERFGVVLDCLTDGFLQTQVCNAVLMAEMDDREGGLVHARILIDSCSGTLLESMISDCKKA
jgi:hypothetical protein